MKRILKEASNWYDKNFSLYQRFSKEMSDIIEKILRTNKISYHSINYRVKEKDSYVSKCQKDKYKNPIMEVMDISGIRIIAYTNQDVIKICDVIKKHFNIDTDNSGNKAEILDDNKVGYLSVHYIAQFNDDRTSLPEYEEFKELKSEIQVRTLLQHAWAEIEHDKNYKFSGVLPLDIKRRFHLVAGVLEMMDREFDNLSKEIDIYAEETKLKTLQGNFDIFIDTATLTQYLINKFKNTVITQSSQDVIVNNEIINELQKFGFEKIKNIDEALSAKALEFVLTENQTYIGLLRDLMMYLDIDKYFTQAYDGGWSGMDLDTIKIFEKKGIDIKSYLYGYDIGIILEDGDFVESEEIYEYSEDYEYDKD